MGITVEFKDFKEMVGFAKQLLGDNAPKVDTKKAPIKTEKAPVKETSTPVQEETQRAEDLPLEEEKAYTLEEVRAALSVLTRNGKQKEVKALLTSFGAKNLSSIDPKDYAAVMEKAGSL